MPRVWTDCGMSVQTPFVLDCDKFFRVFKGPSLCAFTDPRQIKQRKYTVTVWHDTNVDQARNNMPLQGILN